HEVCIDEAHILRLRRRLPRLARQTPRVPRPNCWLASTKSQLAAASPTRKRSMKPGPVRVPAARSGEDPSAFFDAQPPGYRKIVTFWVMSAKQEATGARRLAHLIERSAAGARIDLLKPALLHAAESAFVSIL